MVLVLFVGGNATQCIFDCHSRRIMHVLFQSQRAVHLYNNVAGVTYGGEGKRRHSNILSLGCLFLYWLIQTSRQWALHSPAPPRALTEPPTSICWWVQPPPLARKRLSRRPPSQTGRNTASRCCRP
jgi:hypothetical protein